MSEIPCVLYCYCIVLDFSLTLFRTRRRGVVGGVGLGTSIGRPGPGLLLDVPRLGIALGIAKTGRPAIPTHTLGLALGVAKTGRPTIPTHTIGSSHPVVNNGHVGRR